MKRLLVMIVAALILASAMTGLAFADGGPHGDYTATTDGCAGCHRAHTAAGPRLLVRGNAHDLCVSCHGSAGAGANTNVDDGYYLAIRDNAADDGNVGAANTPDNSLLLGGGFVSYDGELVTSSHDASGSSDLAWGNGVDRGGTAVLADGKLTCTSCHDPHGNDNYRMINASLNSTSPTPALVDEDAAKDYDTEQWGADMSTICAACHGAYHQTAAGTGSDPAQVASGGYTHRVDVQWDGDGGTNPNIGMGTANPESTGMGGFTLPLALTNDPAAGDGLVVCMTCHLPHGTSAAMSGYADPAFDPTGPMGPIAAGDSSLLRLDNRGVCEVCHQK